MIDNTYCYLRSQWDGGTAGFCWLQSGKQQSYHLLQVSNNECLFLSLSLSIYILFLLLSLPVSFYISLPLFFRFFCLSYLLLFLYILLCLATVQQEQSLLWLSGREISIEKKIDVSILIYSTPSHTVWTCDNHLATVQQEQSLLGDQKVISIVRRKGYIYSYLVDYPLPHSSDMGTCS